MNGYPRPMRKLWWRDRRVDLLAPNTPTLSTGRFIVFDETIPKGSAVVVKGVVPYVHARVNPGTSDETFRMITPVEGNGWFSFEPKVGLGAPEDLKADLNAAQNAIIPSTGAANANINNNDRWQSGGLAVISDDPLQDAALFLNSDHYAFEVLSEQRLQIVFRLLTSSNGSVALANPISNPYAIGANAGSLPTPRRVDFAGCIIVGEIMPDTLYKQLQKNESDIEQKVRRAKLEGAFE